MFDLFANITPVYLLYLFYGVAFMFLGVSIAAKDMKGSDLQLADSLWLLGMFGFLHGAHEWLELGPLIEGKNLVFQQIFAIKTVSATVLFISFIFLLQFGLSLVRVLDDAWKRWTLAIHTTLFIVWALYIWYFGNHFNMQFLQRADIGARYTFGVAGGLITAYGLVAHSREIRILSRSVSKKLYYAGIAFIFYAVLVGIFSSGDSGLVLPVPVELLRGMLAFVITYFMANALNIFDIETRMKVEQHMKRVIQVEKLSSLGQLAAGVAHEINNPLTNASLGIQTLKHQLKIRGNESEIVARLDTVERNLDRASLIAGELLQFSRQGESEFVPCNINHVIKGALTLLRHKLNNIIVRHSPDAVPDVMGDPVKLEQVFVNILSNAVEAMPGGGEIAVTTSLKDGKVHMRICDTGVGIPPEHLQRVFDPFFTTKGIGVGTGLGLSICYGIIRQHRGVIDITSEVGKGTTVSIKIPAREKYAEL